MYVDPARRIYFLVFCVDFEISRHGHCDVRVGAGLASQTAIFQSLLLCLYVRRYYASSL